MARGIIVGHDPCSSPKAKGEKQRLVAVKTDAAMGIFCFSCKDVLYVVQYASLTVFVMIE